METKTKMTAQLKQEVLTAIKKADFEFEQNLEGDVRSSANCSKEIESKNFNIVVDLTETVLWSAFDDYEFENLELTDLSVTDADGIDYEYEFTDEEILNAINY